MNPLAERYVRLVLAVGEHDRDYVDAYYGPAEWRDEVKAEHLSLGDIAARAAALADDIAAAAPLDAARGKPGNADEMTQLRHRYL